MNVNSRDLEGGESFDFGCRNADFGFRVSVDRRFNSEGLIEQCTKLQNPKSACRNPKSHEHHEATHARDAVSNTARCSR